MKRLFALLALSTACAAETNVTKLKSEVGVSAELIDFGTVPVGATSEQILQLWTVDGAESTLDDVVYLDDNDGFFGWDGAGGVIPAGDVLDVVLLFTPATDGLFSSRMKIVTNNEQTEEKELLVRGQAVVANAERWPDVLDLGILPPGIPGTGVAHVRNTGGVQFQMVELLVDPPGVCTVDPPNGPVPAGETVDYTVICTSDTDAPFRASLSFNAGGAVLLDAIEIVMNDCDHAGASTADNDGDGYAACGADCDDSDPNSHPGAVEVCDGVDNNCDNVVDENTECYDDDGDGLSELDGDCNDGDPNVFPGQAEDPVNGIDDDCDGVVDLGSSDHDGDGYGPEGGDCDDTNDTVHPGAVELADGIDNDCDGIIDEGTVLYDDDGDGQTESGGDCDDTNVAIYAGATELPDWSDNDCDGDVDEGTVNFDDDGDGYTEVGGDCDDANASINPGEPEVRGNSVDENCDGTTE